MLSIVRRTRIVCTIGPTSASPAVLRSMVKAPMDVARLNFSHGNSDTHRLAAANLRQAAEAAGRQVALLGDLQGPKVRTGALDLSFQRLVSGRRVVIVGKGRAEAPTRRSAAQALRLGRSADGEVIEVSHLELVDALQVGDWVLLDDGRIELVVRSVGAGRVECSVVRCGLLGERKGVSVPGRTLALPALTEKDLEDLKLAIELGIDYLALSLVRRPEDVLVCKQQLAALGSNVPVIAKLEKREAIRELSKILEVADTVMVARGDLGVELNGDDVPAVQKDVIDRANRAGVPVITATEMLESMVTSNRPTRAETADVANAIWDGTDAVMLSQETAIGAHPVEVVRAIWPGSVFLPKSTPPSGGRGRSGVSPARWEAPSRTRRPPPTTSWALERSSPSRVGQDRAALQQSLASSTCGAASPHAEVLWRTALYSGVILLLVSPGQDTDEMISNAIHAARESGLVRTGDRVVVVAGVPEGRPGQTNLLKVETA